MPNTPRIKEPEHKGKVKLMKGCAYLLGAFIIGLAVQVSIGVSREGLPLMEALWKAVIVTPVWLLGGMVFTCLFAIPVALWFRWRNQK